MPLGMMQHSTAPSGFLGAMSMSAIAAASTAMEKILDLVDNEPVTDKNKVVPDLDSSKKFQVENPVCSICFESSDA
jgi:hypothetical protein